MTGDTGAGRAENSASSLGDPLKSLNDRLSGVGLKSSTRILILILLAMNRKMSAVELRALLGLGKGSLENHLATLEAAGYVRTRNAPSFRGLRLSVEITETGLESCRALLRSIRDLEV